MTTRTARLASVIAAAGTGAALLAGAAGSAGAAEGRPFHLDLSGAQEVTGTGAPGNPHGDADHGSMTLTLNPGHERICWSVEELVLTSGEALPHAAHIHSAPAGVSGAVVVDLFRGDAPTSYPTGTRCVHEDRSVILDILRKPSQYYANLHNSQHPGGVVRAQLK